MQKTNILSVLCFETSPEDQRESEVGTLVNKIHPLPSPTPESGYALISTKRYTDPKPSDLSQVTEIHVFAAIFLKILSSFD